MADNSDEHGRAEDDMQERFFLFPPLLELKVAFFSPHTSLRAECAFAGQLKERLAECFM